MSTSEGPGADAGPDPAAGQAHLAEPQESAYAEVVRAWLRENGLEWRESAPGMFSFGLPGEKKLETPVRLDLGVHALAVHAFVCRAPDENHEAVYRWLLQRNLRLYGVAFALDRLGDVYLDARLPLELVTPEQLDRLLGAVLATADESFNALLELGFASSIRKEWEWRRLRGESTANLAAFRDWLEAGDPPAAD